MSTAGPPAFGAPVDQVPRRIDLRHLVVPAAVLCSLMPATGRAAELACATPNAAGATVDNLGRCSDFRVFKPEGSPPDARVVKNLHLKEGEQARSIAVVVAVGTYKDSRYNVPSAVDDAEALADFLVNDQAFDEVIVLENEKATIENIRYYLRTYALQRSAYYNGKVRFLFTYSGHGVRVPFPGYANDPATSQPSAGLLLSAARGDDDYTNIYGLSELRALFNDLGKSTYHFLALINACYPGDTFGVTRGGGSYNEAGQPGAIAITAGPLDQEVVEADDGKGSLFFETIITGIRNGEADVLAQQATLGQPNSDPHIAGLVRSGELDEYLGRQMHLHFGQLPTADDNLADGNNHHWMGSVEPFDVVSRGAFFFFGPKPTTKPGPKFYAEQFKKFNWFEPPFTNTFTLKDTGPLTAVFKVRDGLDELRRAGKSVKGIDVSRIEGAINWPKVALQDISFAYIKATQGSASQDPKFQSNWSSARSAGLSTGAYHVFSPCKTADEQFALIKQVVPKVEKSLPMALDIEPLPSQQCGKAIEDESTRKELARLAQLITDQYGSAPLLYVTEAERDLISADERLKKLHLWVARYGLTDGEPAKAWSIWQYTANAKVEGVPGHVDLNVLSAIK